MNNDLAVATVMEYIERYLTEPSRKHTSYEFQKHSYEQFAASDILSHLLDEPFGDPLCIVEDYVIMSGYFSHLAFGSPDYFIFDTVHQTALDIQSLLTKEKNHV